MWEIDKSFCSVKNTKLVILKGAFRNGKESRSQALAEYKKSHP